MKYIVKAQVWRSSEVILAETQKVDSLDEAVSEQKRWLEWWHSEESLLPGRAGWTDVELKIERRML